MFVDGNKVRNIRGERALVLLTAMESPQRWKEIFGNKPYMDWDRLKF